MPVCYAPRRARVWRRVSRVRSRPDFLDSSLTSAGDGQRLTVPATSLAKIVTEAGYERCSVVCDIEGAELVLLRNEGELFRKVVEAVLPEVHPAMGGTRRHSMAGDAV